jgi:hypothetical protein
VGLKNVLAAGLSRGMDAKTQRKLFKSWYLSECMEQFTEEYIHYDLICATKKEKVCLYI